jgi:high affinity cGMP-specific 3',5'-cyclic phosphodiesterase 9
MNILMKVADVSNEIRPFSVSMPWINCLCTEFSIQYDLEKLVGIPPTPFMNMKMISMASSQIGFIKFVLIPLYEAFRQLFPVAETQLLAPIRGSLAYWLAVEDEMSKQKKRHDTVTQLDAMLSELRSYDLTPSNIMLHLHKY